MNLLILDEEFPFPTNTGKRTRSFHLYRRLAVDTNIRYLGYGDEHSVAASALRRNGIVPIAVPATLLQKSGLRFYLSLFANLASPLPYIVSSHYSAIYSEILKKQLVDFQPDAVLCEWTPYTIYVKDLAVVEKVLSAHNVEADIWKRYYENEPNGPRRWYIKEQWRKVEKFERSALSWVDAAFAVSENDCARLAAECPGPTLAVIPNGVDLEYFLPLPQPVSRQHLVFTGSMDWRPNQDAARYFVREIFPRLRKARPELGCTFVGRSPPLDIQELANVPGVHITGTVDDVRPYVECAAVYIVPLRIGGGTRLKILEAMAMGRAIVSTTVGAEGLDVIPGVHLVIADDPSTFAASVLELLSDCQRCAQLGVAGRSLVEQHYGWDALARRLRDFISEAVTAKKKPGRQTSN